jgi:alkanesulfonate monooxygenase SsuD/methylene tetrahydromethanopterin reductase-like flavin-dependent oxidoreductase (luciferase family)
MPASERSPVGLVLGSALAPERLAGMAVLGEERGYGELWFAEDYFFTGGISGATAALAATQRIPVGLGIVSAVVRHPALLAMELATISRMYPGRLLPGIGLGVPGWIRQMGLHPKSQLTAMRECVSSARKLLDGEEVTFAGESFSFDGVKLTHPPAERVPLYMGVIGPKMLQLSGEIADGTVTSVLASPGYIEWTREQLAIGAGRSGRSDHHRIACFVLFAVDRDGRQAKESLRQIVAFYLAAMGANALTDVYGTSEQLREMVGRGGVETVASEMPDDWLDDLVVAGDPDECAAKIRRYLEAGADSVVIFPTPVERAEEIVELAAREVLPRV